MAKSYVNAVGVSGQFQPGGLVSLYDLENHPANVWFVDSGAPASKDAAGYGRSRSAAFATIAYALTQCTASQGDVIYVMPGHAETRAVSELDFNVAGVSIIGIGNRNNAPLITLTGTTGQLVVSADNVKIKNIGITTATDELVLAWKVTGAYFVGDNLWFKEATSKQVIAFISLQGTYPRLENIHHVQGTAPATASVWIALKGATGAVIRNVRVFLACADASYIIAKDTTDSTGIFIEDVKGVLTVGTSSVPVSIGASTGYLDNIRVASPKTAIAGSIAGTAFYAGLCYASHVADKTGLQEPAVDT